MAANTAGMNSPTAASASSAAFEPAIAGAERLQAVAQPAGQHAAPSTSSRLPMIEPVIDALTTVDQAGLEREERDDQLGDVAEGRVEDPADLGPGERAEPLRREADDPGQAEDRRGRDDEDRRALDVEHEVEDGGDRRQRRA